MKKVFLSIAVAILVSVSSSLFAQGVGLGVKAGVNFANQSITDISTDSKTGFLAGGYLVINFSETFGLQPEVLFSSVGSELPDGTSDFSYLTVPVLLRWKPMEFLSFEAGPQFGFLLNAEHDGDDIADDIKNSDFGLAVGGTVHLPLGFNASLRYVWGFTNVSDLGNDTEIKNSMVQLAAGWTIFGAK